MPEGPLPADLPALQRFLDAWIKQRGGYWSPLSQYARLAEEVGALRLRVDALEQKNASDAKAVAEPVVAPAEVDQRN